MSFSHIPVMAKECIDALKIKKNGIYIDCTMGGAGHSSKIAEQLSDEGLLIAIDQDADAIKAGSERLSRFKDRVRIVQANFSELREVLDSISVDKADGLLVDLGVSSHQLDSRERGFSYHSDAPLDMRMNQSGDLSAFQVVNEYSEEQLKKILFEYGEERYSPQIAARIVRERAKSPISTTAELSEIIKSAFPPHARWEGKHPAKRSFQAIRIEVNHETEVLEKLLGQLLSCISPGGRIAAITFHSLEDRLVKQGFKEMAEGCTCSKDLPYCVCGNQPKIKIITKKPILPTEEEQRENPRAHSAKLRVAEIL